MEKTNKKDTILTKGFIIVCLINFAYNMGQYMTNTLIPRYANVLGAGAQLIGFISSAFAITALIVKPISAPAIDSFNKKKVLTVGMAFACAAFVGYAFSTTPTMMVIFRLVHGVATGISVTTCLTMVSDCVSEEKLTSAIAYFSMIQALATAIGPSIGLSLSDKIGYKYTFLMGAACQVIAFIILFFYNQPEKAQKKPFKVSLESSVCMEAILPACTMLFLSATYSTINSYLVIYAEDMGISGIGTFFTVYAIALLVCRPAIGKLTGKMGAGKLLPYSVGCYAIGMILIAVSKSLPGFLLASVFVAFGYGACQPITQAICISCAPPERRGAASSTSYYGTDIGYLLCPFTFGKIADKFGYRVMFFTTVISLAIAMLIYFTNSKKFGK
jgi:predicted MFS family arabinose efflux permease